MTTDENVVKYLWRLSVVFISYLLIGSFVVSGDYVELLYLIILYTCIIATKISDIKNKNHSTDEE